MNMKTTAFTMLVMLSTINGIYEMKKEDGPEGHIENEMYEMANFNSCSGAMHIDITGTTRSDLTLFY